MRLTALGIHDDPAAWAAAGFAVDGEGRTTIGEVTFRIGPGTPAGAAWWSIDGFDGDLDGVPAGDDPGEGPAEHPNGCVAVDHVVVVTDDLNRTRAAWSQAGLEPRRLREAGPVVQAFYLLETTLAEVVGPAPGGDVPVFLGDPPVGASRLWGLTLSVADLDATAALLGDRLGPVTDAVQPGRRIATLRPEAGLAVPVAFMTLR